MLLFWFFGGFVAKKPHHQSSFRVSGKTSVTPYALHEIDKIQAKCGILSAKWQKRMAD
jgi:hypothetical protein